MGLFGVCISSTHLTNFPCGVWVEEMKNYPLVRYETISFFQFEVKCMPWSFGWRTLTAAALKERVFQLGQERFLHTLTLLISILIGTKDAISRDNIKDYS